MTQKRLKTTSWVLGISLIAVSAAQAGSGHYPAPPSLIPSNPEAGECYARVKIPARYETRGQQVVVQEGYTEYGVEQPQIMSRAEQVMVKEPSVEYRVRQPRYTTVTDQIMTRPAYEKLQVSQPEFQTITETVQMTSPRLVWKKGNPGKLRAEGYIIHSTADAGPSGQGYRSTVDYGAAQSDAMHCGPTCEIWCLVEEPGQSVSYNRRVLKNPSMVNRVMVPARYETITKQVVADPGGVEEIPIPAEYKTIMVEDVLPARATGAHEVAPVYEEVAVQVPVEDERWEWRRVVCETGTYLEPTAQSQSYSGYSSGMSGASTSHGSSSGYSYSSGHSGSYSSGSSYGSTGSSYQSGHTTGQVTSGSYGSGSHSGGGHYAGAYGGTYSHTNTGTTQSYDPKTGYYENVIEAYEGVKRENRRYRR